MEVLKAPLPSCIPKTCICPDGSEQPLPTLPNRILKKVSRVLERISAKIQSKLTKVCENGVDPTVCECDNVLLKGSINWVPHLFLKLLKHLVSTTLVGKGRLGGQGDYKLGVF